MENNLAGHIPDNNDSDYNQTVEDSYTLSFDDSVIEKIAGISAREIRGILDMKGNFISGITENFTSGLNPTKGISANIDGKNVVLELKIILEYGASAPDIFAQLKEHIRTQLEKMTGMYLKELNVRIVDVMTRKEFDKANNTTTAQIQNSYEKQGYRIAQNRPY